MNDIPLSDLERRILADYQRDLPLESRPYQVMAEQLDVREIDVINGLKRLESLGIISRVGAVFPPNSVGASTLAAMSVPEEDLARVAAIVSAFGEVNHNYAREHAINLWFVVAAPDEAGVQRVIAEIEKQTNFPVLDLPMIEDFHLDLGFDLEWKSVNKTAA